MRSSWTGGLGRAPLPRFHRRITEVIPQSGSAVTLCERPFLRGHRALNGSSSARRTGGGAASIYTGIATLGLETTEPSAHRGKLLGWVCARAIRTWRSRRWARTLSEVSSSTAWERRLWCFPWLPRTPRCNQRFMAPDLRPCGQCSHLWSPSRERSCGSS